jgi:FkbM family methyltransferase
MRFMHLRQRCEQLILRLGLFEPLRLAYQFVFNRPYRRRLQEWRRLFQELVRPNSLVFDIGANKGELTAIFRRMGARVVAVEPNHELADRLRRRFRDAKVVEAAVASQEGRAVLHLGLDSNYSTISERWKPIVAGRSRLSGLSVEVAVTTLDSLIARFGAPSFVKVDVEGNELEVFRGLSSAVDGFMFEYQCPLLDDFEASVGALDRLARYEYGTDVGGRLEWTDAESIIRKVRRACEEGAGSGDVFVRRVTS